MGYEMWDDIEPGTSLPATTSAQSKRPAATTEQPTRAPMKAGIKPADRKRADNDQKKHRRQMRRSAAASDIVCPLCNEPNPSDAYDDLDGVYVRGSGTLRCPHCGNAFDAHSGVQRDSADLGDFRGSARTASLTSSHTQHTPTQHSATKESDTMTENTEAALLRRMAAATTLVEQSAIAAQIEDLRASTREASVSQAGLDWGFLDSDEGDWTQTHLQASAAAALAGDSFGNHLGAGSTTETSDWLLSTASASPSMGEQDPGVQMRAQATLWYSDGVWEPVKQSPQEFKVQANNAARRAAGAYGLSSTAAASVFLAQVDHLRRKDGMPGVMAGQYPSKSCGSKEEHGQHIWTDKGQGGTAYACFGYTPPKKTSSSGMREATPEEQEAWLSGHASIPGAEETSEGLLVPKGFSLTAAWGTDVFDAKGSDPTVPTYVSDGRDSLPVGVDPAKADTFDEDTLGGTDGTDPKTQPGRGEAPSLNEGSKPEGDSSASSENTLPSNLDASSGGFGDDKTDRMSTQGGSMFGSTCEKCGFTPKDRSKLFHSAMSDTLQCIDGAACKRRQEKANKTSSTLHAAALFGTDRRGIETHSAQHTADAVPSNQGLGLGIDEGSQPEGDQAASYTQDLPTGDLDKSHATPADRDVNWTTSSTHTAATCSCATNTDGTKTTMLCPIHASEDPCWTMARVTGGRRKGSIVRGTCTNCGWSSKSKTSSTHTADGHTGFVCKTCGGESPIGIGYAVKDGYDYPAKDPNCSAFHKGDKVTYEDRANGHSANLSPNAKVFAQTLATMASLDDVVAGVSGREVAALLLADDTVPEGHKTALRGGRNPFAREAGQTQQEREQFQANCSHSYRDGWYLGARCYHCGKTKATASLSAEAGSKQAAFGAGTFKIRNGLQGFLESEIGAMTFPEKARMELKIDGRLYRVNLVLETATGDDGSPVHGDVSGYYAVNFDRGTETYKSLGGNQYISPGKPGGPQQAYAARNTAALLMNNAKWLIPEGEESYQHEWDITVSLARDPYFTGSLHTASPVAGPLDQSAVWSILLNDYPGFGQMTHDETSPITQAALAAWHASDSTDMYQFLQGWIAQNTQHTGAVIEGEHFKPGDEVEYTNWNGATQKGKITADPSEGMPNGAFVDFDWGGTLSVGPGESTPVPRNQVKRVASQHTAFDKTSTGWQVGDVLTHANGTQRKITRISPAGSAGTSHADGPTYHATVMKDGEVVQNGHTAPIWSKSMSYPTKDWSKVGSLHTAANGLTYCPVTTDFEKFENGKCGGCGGGHDTHYTSPEPKHAAAGDASLAPGSINLSSLASRLR